MSTPSSDNVILGQGQLFFDRFDMSTGIAIPTHKYRHLGNCETFNLTPTTEVADKMTSMYSVKRKYKSVVKRSAQSGKIVLDEFTGENLAMALMADAHDFVRPAIDYTGAKAYVFKYPVVEQDRYLTLPQRNLDSAAGMTVSDQSGGTTYLSGTDFVPDYEHGRVYVVPGGSITAGAMLKVGFKAKALTAADGLQQMAGATTPSIYGRLIFVGCPITGPTYYGDFWHVSLSPEGDMGLISDDFAQFTLNFKCMDRRLEHPGEPFFRVTQIS